MHTWYYHVSWHGLLPVYTQKSTLRRTLTKVKTKQKNRDKGVVYRIPCEECSKVYIGETGRPLKMRIAEHVRAVKNGDVKNANTVHEDVMNHKINWRGAEVIDREMAVKERRIKYHFTQADHDL